jgi:two-component system cell cycle response regulator
VTRRVSKESASGAKKAASARPLSATNASDLESVLGILKALSARREPSDVLFTFTSRIAETLTLDRCSVVRVTGPGKEARVVASHEDAQVKDLPIDLEKYPELTRAMDTGRSIIINDVAHHPQTKQVASDLKASGITALVVVPILFEGRLGTLVLRAARRGGSFAAREVRFCELIAESAANALERAYLLEDLKRANTELEHLARTDELTGLYNQRYFRQRLAEECSRAARYGSPLACMFMDVDNFKSVNDLYGHLAGDGVLRELGARTLKTTRGHDIVARYGGEEIVILLPQTDYDGALTQAQRLLHTVSGKPFPRLPETHGVTVSIGLAMYDTAAKEDGDALLARADAALYEAKARGKNRIVLGDKEYA